MPPKVGFLQVEAGFWGTGCTAKKASGSDLLSHTVTGAVPSALEGLTSVFEMGTGVSPPQLPPESLYTFCALKAA